MRMSLSVCLPALQYANIKREDTIQHQNKKKETYTLAHELCHAIPHKAAQEKLSTV
jgi:Zn-dependent peptidase ImmA (M78 family)